VLTRTLYLATIWFAISLAATLLGGHRLRRLNPFLSLGWLMLVILLGDVWVLFTFGIVYEVLLVSAGALLFGLILIFLLPDWNAFGQVTWAMTLLSTLVFILYSFMITAFTPLNTVSFVLALDFFLIEAIALLMALTHAFESLDLFCRVRWKRQVDRIPQVPGYFPLVSLHVPAYNEPPAVLRHTLDSLARLDYPNYEVLVIDNNTPGEENWLQIRDMVQRLGPKFRFVHLDHWPGYKSGALNFALANTAPEAEIISSIDADYIVEPNFLRELVPAFANPRIGFVQAPQDYRYNPRDPFSDSTYFGYRYFFEVSMPVRNEHNAIIFCGTMGLIRKSALQEIGGWDEWCITEDAEASLRILKLGYQSLYIKRRFGRGLMPYTFEGLKKQRFRWCFGGIQILRKHWSALMPWAKWLDPNNHLTGAQRYFYLVGGLQWFTDVLNLTFGVFLTLGAIASIFYGIFSIRPLTGALLVLPAVFLLLHLWRFLWVLRQALHLRAIPALRAMYNFFSLGWAVTLACFQGLIQKKGVFLRTPKTADDSKVLGALRVTQWESLIGLTFLGAGAAAYLSRPEPKTLWLGLLLAWQASLFLAAPYFSLLSIRSTPGDTLQQPALDRGQAVVENRAARWAWAAIALLAAVAWLAVLLPLPRHLPGYARYQPPEVPPQVVIGIQTLPPEQRAALPTATAYILPTAQPTYTQLPTATLASTPLVLPTITSTTAPTSSPTSTLPPASTATPAAPTASPTLASPPPIVVSPTVYP
jgi:cellulose synthase/poly-beta-1,6-N-acetylglucosamine synthase-like glycosyltransferase